MKLGHRVGGALAALAVTSSVAGLGWGQAERGPGVARSVEPATLVAADVGPDAWASIEPESLSDDAAPAASTRPAVASAAPSPWLVLDPSFRLGDPPYRVVRVTAPSAPVFDRPDAAQPRLDLASRTSFGGPRVLLVVGGVGDRLEVLLPFRPNDSVGWVPAAALTDEQVTAWVRVDLATHTLTAVNEGRRIAVEPAATGTGGTPTPRGIYYVTDIIRAVGQPAYGPFALALSAHSDVLYSFAGGDGIVGIHGTNAPGALGQSVSHGCVRVSNAAITALAQALPLGTPVFIS